MAVPFPVTHAGRSPWAPAVGQADVSLGAWMAVLFPDARGVVALGPGGECALGHPARVLNHCCCADFPNNLPFFTGRLQKTVCHHTQLCVCKLKTVHNNGRRTQEILSLFSYSVILYQNVKTEIKHI